MAAETKASHKKELPTTTMLKQNGGYVKNHHKKWRPRSEIERGRSPYTAS